MQRIEPYNLESGKMYYIELDNDSTCTNKHYGKFINFTHNNTYAYFENIKKIKNTNISYSISTGGNGYRIISDVYWKFYKMQKYDIEKRITNSIIQQITGDSNFNYI